MHVGSPMGRLDLQPACEVPHMEKIISCVYGVGDLGVQGLFFKRCGEPVFFKGVAIVLLY